MGLTTRMFSTGSSQQGVSSCRCDKSCRCNEKRLSVDQNPRASRFTIKQSQEVGNHLVVRIRYWDATNYGGDKILVYLNTDEEQLRSRKEIDPHFLEREDSPYARFEPTRHGFDAAVKLCEVLS